MMKYLRLLSIVILSSVLVACAGLKATEQNSYLQEGKRQFAAGYYREAMKVLLPLACDGVAEAQYAVGYMYYYGYGVAQDTVVGRFWIERAARQHFKPAERALHMINAEPRR